MIKKTATIIILIVFCVFQTLSFTSCGKGNAEHGKEEKPKTEFVYFGTYPQKDVTEEKGAELAKYAEGLLFYGDYNGWTSYKYYISGSNDTDYMWYKDVDVDSDGKNDYRGVYFTEYRPDWAGESASYGYQSQNGYYTYGVYWFGFEPIKWKILDYKDGKALILAELILDSQDYNHGCKGRIINKYWAYGNNYEYSTVRAWLNETFYNTAFSETEKVLINTVEVDNSVDSTLPNDFWSFFTDRYICENTNDRVFLLSVQEATNANYGFSTSLMYADTKRQKKGSDYAKIQGLCAFGSSPGYWWLRSPSENEANTIGDAAFFVHPNGGNSYMYSRVDCTPCGIVPAMQITISVE